MPATGIARIVLGRGIIYLYARCFGVGSSELSPSLSGSDVEDVVAHSCT
jgi:hypothetical protein